MSIALPIIVAAPGDTIPGKDSPIVIVTQQRVMMMTITLDNGDVARYLDLDETIVNDGFYSTNDSKVLRAESVG